MRKHIQNKILLSNSVHQQNTPLSPLGEKGLYVFKVFGNHYKLEISCDVTRWERYVEGLEWKGRKLMDATCTHAVCSSPATPGDYPHTHIQVCLCSAVDFSALAVLVEACGPCAASDCTCQIVYIISTLQKYSVQTQHRSSVE